MLRLYYGDFETAARARASRSAGGATNYRTASYYMLDCGSGVTAERLATLRADPARLLVGDRSAFYQAVCQAWDADLGDAFRANFDTSIPTVIVHGNRDVNTPYENALELAPHFTRGKLVTVVGGTHGALNEALEADTAFANSLWHFVRTGDRARLPDSVVLPPIDWSVPADLEALARRVMGPGGDSSR
jgi:pimeloyl-ACP methyl ester carboxylesterase